MKRWKKLLAAVLAITMTLSSVPGYGLEVKAADSGELVSGDYKYYVNEDGNSVTIREYAGSGGDFQIKDGVLKEYLGKGGNVIIPDGVTSIGEAAFYGCSGLTGVTIPNSVTSIEKLAFYGCSALTGVTIPNSVASIGDNAFDCCNGLTSMIVEKGNPRYDSRDDCNAIIETKSNTLVWGCNNTVIPDGVMSIGDAAFYNCGGLTSVTIPDSVTSIGLSAFWGCSGLTSVTIPDSVTSIGQNTFWGCSGLTNVTISNSMTSIENYAFYGCSGLTNVTIPNNVANIGAGAFSGCSGLTSMTIPNSVMSIGYSVGANIEYGAFSGCSGLMSIIVEEGNPRYDSRDDCNAIIETESNALVRGCNKTVIPNSVTSIGDGAFSGCNGLTSVTIPNSVTSIGYNSFDDCSGLTSIIVEEGNPRYDSRDDCNAIIETESNALVRGCNKTVIPNSVTSIGDTAFSGSGLTSVTIPNSVTGIGLSAFWGCSGLTSVTIPDSVTSIQSYAFGYLWKVHALPEKIPNFTIYGTSGSEAERYAKNNGFTFRSLGSDSSQGDKDKIDISNASVTLSKTSYTYDGKPKTPSVTVKLGTKTLSLNTDFTISYSNNINVGTAKATVTGKGNYTGSKAVNFTITKTEEQTDTKISCKKTVYKVAYGAKPFKINASSKSRMTFTSSKPKVAAVDKNTGKVTIKNTGIATITIKAGKASKKVAIKVSPKKPSVKSTTAVKGKKLTVRWAKDKRASGYQVQVSTDKKFKKGVKSKNLSKTSYTFTKLKTGKKYYVRVRSYKKSGKETLYSAWSKAKSGSKIKR